MAIEMMGLTPRLAFVDLPLVLGASKPGAVLRCLVLSLGAVASLANLPKVDDLGCHARIRDRRGWLGKRQPAAAEAYKS
jgi:hypothetical protein